MTLYWVEKATGRVAAPVDTPNPVPHSDWLIIDAVLPGPIETCKWNGSDIVVDGDKTTERKDNLRKDVWRRVEKPFTISQGGKDYTLTAQQRNVLVSMLARAQKAVQQNDATWTLNVRADDGTTTTLSASNVIDFIERIGNRLRNRWDNIIAKEQALDAATANDLGTFDPDVN